MNLYMKLNASPEYPYYYGDIQLEHPDFVPGNTPPDGWIEVKDISPPQIQKYQVLEEGSPSLINGEFFRSWKVRDMTSNEIENSIEQDEALQKLQETGLTHAEIDQLISRIMQ